MEMVGETRQEGSGEIEKLQAALLHISQELQGVKNKLSLTSNVNNEEHGHISKITEIHAKVEWVSIALLDSKADMETSETTKLIEKLKLEVISLKHELEKAKATEAMLVEAKKYIAQLKMEVEEAKKGEKSPSGSLSSLTKELDEKTVMLHDAETKVALLEAKVESLHISLERLASVSYEASSEAKEAKEKLLSTEKKLETLKLNLRATTDKYENEKKQQEKESEKKIQNLLEEKQKLVNEEEESKKKLLSTQTELQKAEAQIEDLKLSLQTAKENYQAVIMVKTGKWKISNLSNPLVFFDVSVDGASIGRIVFELFADKTPRKAENFRALCTGEKGIGQMGKPLHYKGSTLYYIYTDHFYYGGDFNNNDGSGSESALGSPFEDDDVIVKATGPGFIGMSPVKEKKFGSVFLIRTDDMDLEYVFGFIVDGLDVMKKMDKDRAFTKGGRVKGIKIDDCGQLM